MDLHVGFCSWYFEPGTNVFHVYSEQDVDRVFQDLVKKGAEKIQVFTPGVTPEGESLPTLPTTTTLDSETTHLDVAPYSRPRKKSSSSAKSALATHPNWNPFHAGGCLKN